MFSCVDIIRDSQFHSPPFPHIVPMDFFGGGVGQLLAGMTHSCFVARNTEFRLVDTPRVWDGAESLAQLETGIAPFVDERALDDRNDIDDASRHAISFLFRWL